MFGRYLGVVFTLSLNALPLNGAVSASLENQNDVMQSGIKHVVVLMLENRSFDHALGWLYTKDEPLHFIPAKDALPFQGLSNVSLNNYTNILKDSSGNVVFTCAPIHGVPSTIATNLINSPADDPNEPFDNVTKQIFGPSGSGQATMLGFLQDYASLWDEEDWVENKRDICAVMETYTSKELPYFHGLARHYAVSDLWFSSVPTQTNPNRAFFVCGTSDGQIINGSLGKSTFDSDTIWNRLTDESPDTTWTIFWQSDMLPEIFPGPFDNPRVFSKMSSIPNLNEHYEFLDAFHEQARQGNLPDFSFIEPQWTFSKDIQLEAFEIECPDSPYVAGIQGNDLHPPGDVRTAENLLANIYTSLISNPEAWENTLFVILFDEHGGIFDHVPPPAALAPDQNFQNGFTFDRYGVRTPALFISPRIKKGTVIRSESEYPFDHTSFIATILKWKNIDKGQWNMGKRVDRAPTFERVITENVPRNDPIIAGPKVVVSPGAGLNMGDAIVLKNPQGKYLTVSSCENYATVGVESDSASIQFCPASGKITHGSFILIQSKDPSLSGGYLLDSDSSIGDCYYNKNNHSCSQWWTIKSVDNPYLGYEIKSGDRVYLENHIYLDPTTFVPGRLITASSLLLGESVSLKPINEEGIDDCYWIIETK